MDWGELGDKIRYIRELYRQLGIALVPGGGLALALDEAEALANGAVSPLPATDENAAQTAHDAHVIWALEQSLRVCIDHGLDLRAHLANIATGTTDFGVPSDENRVIYFKDFEYELFVMASLIREGRDVENGPATERSLLRVRERGTLFPAQTPELSPKD